MNRDAAKGLTSATACLAAVLSAAVPVATGQTPAPDKFPTALDTYLTNDVKLTSSERTALFQGKPVTKLLPGDASREVGVFGTVWINAPASKYVRAVKDIENLEKGENFLITKRISEPPTPDDFVRFELPPDELDDLKQCKVGDCAIKLGADGLARIRKEVDWTKPTAESDAERIMRELMLEYVTGYLQSGNAKLAEYRDSEHPTFVAQEFASMIDRMPEFATYLPHLKQYLLEFPAVTLPNSSSFLYWQEAKFGLKPTVRINHVTIVDQPEGVEVVSKMLYASHYFWTGLELRVLVPDPARGDGFWFVNVNRSRSDGLSGFTGTLIRGKVRAEAEKGLQAALESTKRRMEAAHVQAAVSSF